MFEDFKSLAEVYTPEWNLNENSDDFGVTVSKIFVELLESNLAKLNKALYNYYLTFLNIIGTQPNPPRPSEGFIVIEAVANSQGAYIKKGEKLSAISVDEDEVNFETKEDIFAVDTEIKNIFFVDSKFNGGTIVKIFDKNNYQAEEDLEPKFVPFRLLDCAGFENLNKRFIYFEDLILFNTSITEVIFYFHNKFSLEKEKVLLQIFSSVNAIWQYYDGTMWKSIKDVNITKDNGVKIYFSDTTKITNIMGINSRFIRCSPDTFENLEITSVSYYPTDKNIFPENLICNDEEVENYSFLPFGERFMIYNCFYIKSDEAFSKKKSKIKIDINFKFMNFKTQIKEGAKNYKFMMSDLDFSEINPSDSSIEKVIWEYWNGRGWAKIDPKVYILDNDSNTAEDINSMNMFKPFEGTKNMVLDFFCPDDFEPITVKSDNGYFIRVRISKINNPYDSMATHITPLINKVSINCSYADTHITCDKVFTEFKAQSKIVYFSKDNKNVILLENIKDINPIMYLCFTKPLKGGIISIFFDIEDGFGKKKGLSFKWEYLTKTPEGEYTWKVINVIDLTEGFYHSEIILMVGCENFEKTNLYGAEGYFLRIVNIGEKLRQIPGNSRPLIKDIKINVVKVIQKTTFDPQYFPIANSEKNKVCTLSNKNIFEISVWVNEFGKISTKENEMFLKQKLDFVEPEFNKLGELEKLWIKWQPIDNILTSGPKDRVYQVNFSNSEIIFGDGKTGKIPPSQYMDSIRINYASCDGTKGNIEKNQINDFLSVIPNIASITNFKSFTGGTDIETIDRAARRMFNRICGGDRIISLFDFEDSLLSNDASIDKIKCIPHINKYSEKSIGDFSIAVLPKTFPCGFEKFSGIRKRIFDFLSKNASASFLYSNKGINVFEVIYVEIKTKITAYIDDFNSYQQVYKSIEFEIKQFLNPVTGGFSKKGWQIGDIIHENSIKNSLKDIRNVKWISSIVLFNRVLTEKGLEDVSSKYLEKMKFIVPLFGGVDITLEV